MSLAPTNWPSTLRRLLSDANMKVVQLGAVNDALRDFIGRLARAESSPAHFHQLQHAARDLLSEITIAEGLFPKLLRKTPLTGYLDPRVERVVRAAVRCARSDCGDTLSLEEAVADFLEVDVADLVTLDRACYQYEEACARRENSVREASATDEGSW